MPNTALALVVLAALIHAMWNLMSKRGASAGPSFIFAYNLVSLLAYAPWVIWLAANHQMPWNWQVAFCLAISGLVHLASSLCLQRGYQTAEFSVVYPIARGTGPSLSALCAFALLGEMQSGWLLLGLLTVVVGIVAITTRGNLRPFRTRVGLEGVWWGSATGATIAAYTIVDAYAVKILGIAPVVVIWSSAVIRFALMAPVIARNAATTIEQMKGNWWLTIGVGLLSMLSYISILAAFKLGAPVSVVAPTRELSMLFAVLLGRAILGERIGGWRMVGCLTMIAGVAILSIP